MTSIYITWEQIEWNCKVIADKVRGQEFKNIYGIPRGGLIPAVIISHYLESKLPIITSFDQISNETLVVDDIVDSGMTWINMLRELRHRKVHPKIATLFYYLDSSAIPEFYSDIKEDKNLWFIFPWEQLSTSKYDKTVETLKLNKDNN